MAYLIYEVRAPRREGLKNGASVCLCTLKEEGREAEPKAGSLVEEEARLYRQEAKPRK